MYFSQNDTFISFSLRVQIMNISCQPPIIPQQVFNSLQNIKKKIYKSILVLPSHFEQVFIYLLWSKNVQTNILMAVNYVLFFSSFVFGMAGHVSGKFIPPRQCRISPFFCFHSYPFILGNGLKLGFVWRCIYSYATIHTLTIHTLSNLYLVLVIDWMFDV